MANAGSEPPGTQPILVTGMPRSGTTWVSRMLDASGQVGYLNEPFNLAMSPGTFRIPVDHWYTHITDENEARVLPALHDALAFKYPLARELGRCRSRADLHRTLKGWRTFLRHRNRRPVIKEPHAVFSAAWFACRLSSNVVITVRHPAAVVSSWKRLGWDFDFTNLLEQPLLMRDWLEPFRPDMEAALSSEKDLVDRVALFWSIIYSVVSHY
ncbi:MAG TPA: sulfotransferase, partial [Gemmatimonadales bacterium]|nr:sulfotransferase [Gemmatimonadales bacterium]